VFPVTSLTFATYFLPVSTDLKLKTPTERNIPAGISRLTTIELAREAG